MASLKRKKNIERPQKSRQTEKGRKTGKRNSKRNQNREKRQAVHWDDH